MHLQLKKVDILTLKVDIFTTPGKTHLQVGREKLLIFLVKGEDNGNLFQNVLL